MATKRVAPRNTALEAAIVADPIDPTARMVYSDWLQSIGEPLGAWAALAAAIEADPANVQLRADGVGYLDDHQREILGAGAPILRGGWIGWHVGFVDEIRLQEPLKTPAKRLAALLAQPSSRFVRHLAIGEFSNVPAIVAEVIRAAPPLLESLLVGDQPGSWWGAPKPLEEVAEIATLRRLTLRGFSVSRAMPQLVELSLVTPLLRTSEAVTWLLGRNCPNLEELMIDCANPTPVAQVVADVVGALPKLRRLRLLHLQGADAVVDALAPHLERLEVLDLSHSDLSSSKATALGAKLVAVRCGAKVENMYRLVDGELSSWLTHRLDEGGRAALRLVPGAGWALYNLSTRHREERALQLLGASLTFPDAGIGTYAYANSAGALERLFRFDEAELISREGLLRSPYEPNLFSFLIDALRRSNKLDRALALVPRALATLSRDNPDPHPHQGATGTACLVDCLFTLAQAGQHAKVLKAATEHKKLASPKVHAIVAMSQLALGRVAAAKKTLLK
ncbi:MAG TPA: TIGR02996 domain-containing protein, partial [Kofleriaceae bacterium]